MSKRSNLVVVCAGDASLHEGYLEPHRNYDLCVVYFGEQENRFRSESEHYLACKGTQTQLLERLFRQMPGLLDEYEQFWLSEDDLETNTTDVNHLFDLFRDSDFYIAQPSLKPDSYSSFSMLTCKGLGSCETNFIEFMCPLFSQKSLKSSVQYLSESLTGWGVDELWSVRAIEQGEKLGIFDQVQIGHYRPVGSSIWYQNLQTDPHQESRQLKLKHGLIDRIPQRFHPSVEAPAPGDSGGLPPTSPYIIGGQSGSCLRAVVEILLLSKRMYMDLDDGSEYPQFLDSKCMRTVHRGTDLVSDPLRDLAPGLADPEWIMQVLKSTNSTDYKFSDLGAILQQELLVRGRHMRQWLEESASDSAGFKRCMNALGGKWHRREQWGWKEPHSMYYLPLWKELFGRFRFIHVVRDPRNIPKSHRQAEPEFYEALFGENSAQGQGGSTADFELCWAKANLGVFQWAKRHMPDDYLLLRAEDLAGQDEKARRETSRLLNFAGLNFADRGKTDAVFRLIKQAQPMPQKGLLAEALSAFAYR